MMSVNIIDKELQQWWVVGLSYGKLRLGLLHRKEEGLNTAILSAQPSSLLRLAYFLIYF
jgi:hypothetical protein